jgi:hypothetical protein
MISKSKLAFTAALALASIGSLALGQTAASAAHRHHHYVHHVYSADAGYRANASVTPAAVNPDDPALTGGGSLGFNKCGGHPAC